MSRPHLAEAIGCCLYKVRQGNFVVMRRCEQAHHSVLKQFSSDPDTTFPRFRDDIRDDQERLRLQIACRRDTLLPGDVFSHVSAALIHGLDPVITGTRKVEVSRKSPTRNYSSLFVYSRDIGAEELTSGLTYSATTLVRTLRDVALDHSLEVSVPLISQALSDRGVAVADIKQGFTAGVRGLKRGRLALQLSSEHHEAPSEAFCAVKFHRYGITGMIPQVEVRSSTGKFIGRNDFQHDTVPVAVEVHGVGKYYLNPEGPDQAAKASHQRNMDLLNAGYRVFNLSFGDLFRPKIFADIKRCIDGLLSECQPP